MEECDKDLDLITDDSNVAPPVCMDELVDNQEDSVKDYAEGANKEPVEQNPDPDKVVEADLAMDPAAATEAYLNNIDKRSAGDPKLKKYLIDKYKASLKIGFNPVTRSFESIRVIDKNFKKHTYRNFTDFDDSDAGIYAREALDNSYTNNLRPVTYSDFDRYQELFANKVFKNAISDFQNKFLNPNIASKCSYTVDKDRYSTIVIKAQFKDKNGKKLPLGCIYALEWYKGKPICTPIVPIMKFGTKYEMSEEGLTGYIKVSDIRKWKGEKSIPDTFDKIFSKPEVKNRIKDLKADLAKKGMTIATIEECKSLPNTFYNKFLRLANFKAKDKDISAGKLVGMKFIKKEGIVWAYWTYRGQFIWDAVMNNKFFGKMMTICAMVKTKSNKITTILFGLFPIDKKFYAEIPGEKSKESYEEFNIDNALK